VRTRTVLFAALATLALLRPARAQQGPIAVIVHPDNPVSNLTIDELRRLFSGNTIMFGNRQRVALAETESERARFYRIALSMNEDRVKRQWISLVFAGEAATPPETFANVEDVKRFVAARPGAIAFIPARALDGSVKAVTIDGRRPGDASYVLRD
jgi:ABC-type phosphate transport system substrate-binding protein